MRYRMVTHVVGHVEHYAGDQMYIHFAGDKLEVVNSESGECRSVEVFVARALRTTLVHVREERKQLQIRKKLLNNNCTSERRSPSTLRCV